MKRILACLWLAILVPVTAFAQLGTAGELGSPLVTEDRIYVGDWAGQFAAIDRSSGEILWTRNLGSTAVFAPVLADGRLIVSLPAGTMLALDPATGETQWEFAAGQVDWPIRDPLLNARPEIFEGDLIVSSEDFNLYRIDPHDGAEVWRLRLGEESQARTIPIHNSTAYLGAWDGFLYAVDLATGHIEWRSRTSNDHIGDIRNTQAGIRFFSSAPDSTLSAELKPFATAAPWIDGDDIFFANTAGDLIKLDRQTGEEAWRFNPGGLAQAEFVGSRYFIAGAGNQVYYSTHGDRRLLGVDTMSGEPVWSRRTQTVWDGPFPLASGIGLWMELSGDWPNGYRVVGFDLESGQSIWCLDRVTSFIPTIMADRAYFSRSGREIIAVVPDTGEYQTRLGDGGEAARARCQTPPDWSGLSNSD